MPEIDIGQISEALNNKMDLDGMNVVASSGPSFRNVSNWSNNMTNCITYIPQDIKLELNNGTLTLKAGSKVYVPNGAGVFNEITTTGDLTIGTQGSYTAQMFLLYYNSVLTIVGINNTTSGTTPPTNGLFYNTSTNTVSLYSGGSIVWSSVSFPIAVVSYASGVPTSIDQVFNGFGYIGSTVFALPGVKGLIPDGRNVDGTLKNIEFTTTSVFTRTITSVSNTNEFTIATTGIGINNHALNEQENYLYNAQGTKLRDRYVAGNITFSKTSPYNVISFTPKTVFHALDYNDKEIIIDWVMPNYSAGISLSVTTSESSYTCTKKGRINYFLGYDNGTDGTYIKVNNVSMMSTTVSSGYPRLLCGVLDVNAGDVIKYKVNTTSTTSKIVFYPYKGF